VKLRTVTPELAPAGLRIRARLLDAWAKVANGEAQDETATPRRRASRYTHRVAISNRRLISADERGVPVVLGSPTANRYLQRAGLLEDLEALGFNIVGYGCTTCIGNSGDLTEPIVRAMSERGIVPVAILSGNRNFPGRVHPQLEAGFLASPPLVVAYALAGDVNLDILTDTIAKSQDGRSIRLIDLWPSGSEIDAALAEAATADDYAAAYEKAEASDMWRTLDAPATPLYPWDPASTYIRRPPFAAVRVEPRVGHYKARPILVVGDDITTDQISPAGAVPAGSEAAKYLIERGENPRDLNVFSARRGNWEAMVRGLFTNKTVKNLLDPSIKPGQTIHMPSGNVLPLWDAAERYRAEGVPVVLLAGERYGMGSSRDWAAKGAALLGVRAVLAASFERIHRSTLSIWAYCRCGCPRIEIPRA
jgi:aconitate hydratase